METDPSPRRSAYISGCMASPTWFPAYRNPSRFHLLSHEATDRSWSWRKLLKRLLKEGKSLCGSKPLTFGYDAVSYSKNFDDGCWNERSGQCYKDAAGWQPRAC